MKILAIGYYDDFARFFLGIKKELLKFDDNIKFKYLSLYLSGFMYWFFRDKNSSWFSLKAWFSALKNHSKYKQIVLSQNEYKNINLSKVVRYHTMLNDSKELKLKIQAISYIDIIENLFNQFSPDIIILSGNSRMSIEILNIKAKERNIKVLYFEQGPFGTTIIDEKGVNANASIRNQDIINHTKDLNNLSKKIQNFFDRKKDSKFKRNPFYNSSDYIFQFATSKINLLPADIEMSKDKKIDKKLYSKVINKKSFNYERNMNKNIFLLVLQVPYDANMIYHSPFYRNHFDILSHVHKSLPENSILLVREHPLYKRKYEQKLYEYVLENDVYIDLLNLNTSIEKAHVVIVNNSTVGIEAISKLKRTVVLGDAYYDNNQVCLKLKKKEELVNVLKVSLMYHMDKKIVLSFLERLFFDYLIDGHYRDSKLLSVKEITKNIINYKGKIKNV